MDDTEETEHQKSGDDIEEENEFLKPDGYGPEAEQPDRVSKKLYPHQLEAVAWLLQGEHGKILSDFMGLGKTLTTIAYILSLNNDHGYKSALIMVPKSVLKNWVKEIEDSVWKETVSFVVMHGSNPGSFDLSVDDLNKLGFVITTPTRFMGNTEEVTIVGECCRFAQARSVRAALTGTPIQNNAKDVFALLRFIGHAAGANGEEFERVVRDIEKEGDYTELHRIQRSCLLQRTYDHKINGQPIITLPPLTQRVHQAKMNDIESQIYEEVLLASILDSVENGEGGNPNKGLFKRMQQACSDPLILLGPKEEHSPLASAYDKAATETMPNMQRIPTLSEFVKSADVKSPPAKVRTLLKALGVVRKKEPRAKFLIFTQWVTFAKSVAFHLKNSGSKIFSFTGALTPNEQEAGIQDFQSLTTKLDGMILTIGAGGEGLNLTAANHVFHLNPTWNPMKEMQGLFRAYRNKQLLPITVHFVRVPVRCGNGGVEPTIEYTIFKKAAIKTEWAEREAGRSAQTDRYELALWNEL